MAVAALKPKNAVESLRDIVQDLLVPELKAIKTELESQRRENKITSDSIRGELDAIRVEMRLRDEKQTQALHSLETKQSEAMLALRTETGLRFEQLNDRLGTLLEVRERLAVLEDRSKRS